MREKKKNPRFWARQILCINKTSVNRNLFYTQQYFDINACFSFVTILVRVSDTRKYIKDSVHC